MCVCFFCFLFAICVDKSHLDDFLTAQPDSLDLKIGMIANSEDEAFDMYNISVGF